jgi:ribonuclease P protein component
VLAAAHRLRRSREFAAAVRGGRRAGRGAVVVHLNTPDLTDTDRTTEPAPARGSDGPATRAGFIVSRAVGGAVVRNKVRRRLRHLVAERLDRLPPACTLVVRALPATATSSYRELGADLDAAIEAARAPRPARASRRRA